jgi:predicted DNA-binding WGR domain protein
MAKRRFHLVDETSNKFWEVWTSGKELHTQHGRIGSQGKLTTKKLASGDATKAAMAKLIAEKTRKGYVEVSAAQAKAAPSKPVARAAPRPPPTTMDDDGFWDILSRLDWKKQGDDDKVLAPAVKALSQMSVADIEKFEVMMAKKLFALDTREHARAVYKGVVDPDDGDEYISADDFLYSRCVMVVNGQKFYEDAVKDPTRMPKDSEFEAVLYLARNAYELKTGEELEVETPVSYESFSNKAGWKRNEATKKGWATSARVPPGNRRPG